MTSVMFDQYENKNIYQYPVSEHKSTC